MVKRLIQMQQGAFVWICAFVWKRAVDWQCLGHPTEPSFSPQGTIKCLPSLQAVACSKSTTALPAVSYFDDHAVLKEISGRCTSCYQNHRSSYMALRPMAWRFGFEVCWPKMHTRPKTRHTEWLTLGLLMLAGCSLSGRRLWARTS